MTPRTGLAHGTGALVLYHCATNTGYAIASLERVFHRAMSSVFGIEGVNYAYPSLSGGKPTQYPVENHQITAFDLPTADRYALEGYKEWITTRNIRFALCFDLGLRSPTIDLLRAAGVESIVSYWGASISGLYPWYLLPLRRLQYLAASGRPDHFVFESEGMRRMATHGAAIPRSKTSVCYLGVDTARFQPDLADADYIHTVFSIPRSRRIVMFSGHMEPRKGVHVLIDAVVRLIQDSSRDDVHLLLLGNSADDESRLSARIPAPAKPYITFGGYRNDVPRLHHGVHLGVIASSGWDSFTMSSIEFASSGIPLIVSDLPGLQEAVEDGVTGLVVPAGDTAALTGAIARLLDDHPLHARMSRAARNRVERRFGLEQQVAELSNVIRRVTVQRSLHREGKR